MIDSDAPLEVQCFTCKGVGVVPNPQQCLTFRGDRDWSYRCQKRKDHTGDHVDHKGNRWNPVANQQQRMEE